ncbi:MAG: 4-alpha-glucanotransferase [Bacteroidota bacterium]
MINDRAAGTLLHVSSLPGTYGCGDFGSVAYEWIDWLVDTQQKWWQILPLDPPGGGFSPYSSRSTFAIHPLFLDLEELGEQGLLPRHLQWEGEGSGKIEWELVAAFKQKHIRKAAEIWLRDSDRAEKQGFWNFVANNEHWLPAYAFFSYTEDRFGPDWSKWPHEHQDFTKTCDELKAMPELHPYMLIQWWVGRQWEHVRTYANQRGVKILGDMPLYVSHHSADVWQHPDLFKLGGDNRPKRVAGAPPDYFNEEGQHWGMPIYNWEIHQKTGYHWWKQRLEIQLQRYDQIRWDHFRGIVGFWEIPAHAQSAKRGWWRRGPGSALLDALSEVASPLPVVAEDLGTITPDITALREQYGLPGMRVLHFAFSGQPDNPHLPQNIREDHIVYTGTHDNHTSEGWYETSTPAERKQLNEVATRAGIGLHEAVHQKMIQLALDSPANLAIIPMQDWLGLGDEARMNIPGTVVGNWRWHLERSKWDLVDKKQIKAFIEGANRTP